MNTKELQRQLLKFAVTEAHQWLRMIPILERRHIYERILKCLVDKFHEHEQELWSFEIHKIADHEYTIQINGGVKATLLIQRKEAPDEN